MTIPAPASVGRADWRPGAIVGLGSFGVLGVIVPTVVLAQGVGSEASTLLTLVLVWAALRLSVLAARGTAQLYWLALLMFVYVFFGLAGNLQVRTLTEPDTTPGLVPAAVLTAARLIAVSIVFIELGRRLAAARSTRRTGGTAVRVAGSSRILDGDRLRRVVPLALVGCVLIILRVGPSNYLGSRDRLSLATTAAWGNPTIAALANGLALALPLVTLHALVRHRRAVRAAGGQVPFTPHLILTAALLAFMVNISSSARISFGTVVISTIVLLGAADTPARVRAFVPTIVGAFVLVFPLADVFRREATGLTLRAPEFDSLRTSGDFDSFAQLANTITYVTAQGVTAGNQLLGVVFFWVPRSVWASKPVDTGVLVGEFRGYRFTNLSAPVWAEAYINFGTLGVCAALLALGYAVRRADDRYIALGSSAATFTSLQGAILPFYGIIVLRGSLLQAVGAAAALLAVMTWVTARRPAPETDGTSVRRRREVRRGPTGTR
ncbi:hypothetical protein [Nocardioides sp.]|uniref:hypothetical protein n=1 Tax=Nocardioides sp. TaxID=35761 RepID=UPI0035163CEB